MKIITTVLVFFLVSCANEAQNQRAINWVDKGLTVAERLWFTSQNQPLPPVVVTATK